VPATQRLQTDAPSPALLNRELSWLDLNARVLDLAADPDEPLLERVKFCSIFSSNLDEFFMVRVAGLLDQVISGAAVRSHDGRTPQQALDEIRTRVFELVGEQSRLWREELCPALAREGVVVGSVEDASAEELADLESQFARQIYPILTPLAVGPGQPFPYISGLSLSLGVIVRDPESGEERFARVKVPEGLDRFVGVGSRGLLIPLESVIGHFLPSLFPEMEIDERVAFCLTRDGDTEISDDADDLQFSRRTDDRYALLERAAVRHVVANECLVDNRHSRCRRVVAKCEIAPEHEWRAQRFEIVRGHSVEVQLAGTERLSVESDRHADAASHQWSDRRQARGSNIG